MMSTPKLGLSQDQAGQAAVEALLVLMILALVIFGGIELSRGVAIRQALDSGSGAAVRALSLDPTQWSFAGNVVQQGVNQNVMGANSTITLQVYDASGNLRSSAWLSGSPFGTSFILEASAPFQADIPFLAEPAMTIRVRHWGIVERYP
ncbi:TadE/TadG family type IV pilus assembly protein [Leptolinea tardivitalis]|nr:TadE family protein [Leptolinea tardivitalis]GAP21903.1 TadE-like protein [Leptolinea tardivitalis]